MKIPQTFLLLLLLALGTMTARADEKTQAGIAATEAWLNLVDTGKYGESWQDTSAIFQAAVPEDQWERTIAALRAPMGDVLSREMTKATYTTSLPGAPDGEYVVIQFKTVFQNKATAIETVTPMRDKDGKWHVSGYYIK